MLTCCAATEHAAASTTQAKREYEVALTRSGVPEPWMLVERLSDEILDDVLQSCAESLLRACDDAVDMVAEAEFKREA